MQNGAWVFKKGKNVKLPHLDVVGNPTQIIDLKNSFSKAIKVTISTSKVDVHMN
jgi:hypothetical protein